MSNIKRLNYLDYIKGVGILLVVLGHIYDVSHPVRIWIYSFHMPLFFIISGILIEHTNIKNRDLKKIIISKFKHLIIPYICFELLAILIIMIQNDFSLFSLKVNIAESILMYCKAGATWFLPCLFVAEVVFIIMIKYINNKNINIMLSVLIFVIPFILKIDNHYLIVILRCFTALGYISIGYFGYNLIINKEIDFKFIILLFLCNMSISYFNGFIDLWNLNFKNPILYFLGSISGVLFIIYSFRKITESKILKYFGQNTIIIMGTQQVILDNIAKFTGQQYYSFFIGIAIFIFVILLEIPIIEIINRYLPFMLGKRNQRLD